MRRDSTKEITLPEGFTATAKETKLTIKGNSKEVTKKFPLYKVTLAVKGNVITLHAKNASKRELTRMGTTQAHIKNMIKGLQEDFTYNLEVCNIHFPMNVKVEGQTVVIKSFLGEKASRKAAIMPNTTVDIKGSSITVTSTDIESAGQTAANIEKATTLTGRDRRIFQDGIFITSKNGRAI